MYGRGSTLAAVIGVMLWLDSAKCKQTYSFQSEYYLNQTPLAAFYLEYLGKVVIHLSQSQLV